METIMSLVRSVGKVRQHDNDWCDRLYHVWTVLALSVAGVSVLVGTVVGLNVVCLMEAHGASEGYADSTQPYVNNYCWLAKTYFTHERRDFSEESSEKGVIKYYQWLPIVLLAQAASFALPNLVWRTFNGRCGFSVTSIVDSLDSDRLDVAANQLKQCFKINREHGVGCGARLRTRLGNYCVCCGRRFGNYLTILYFGVKLTNLGIAFLQFWAINRFLSTGPGLDPSGGTLYPLRVWNDFVAPYAPEWETSGRFPRVTFCDVMMASSGQRNRHKFQCLLPLNMLYEKIYVVCVIWLAALVAVSALNLLAWLADMLLARNRYKWVKKYLKLAEALESGDRSRLNRFVRDALRLDGVLLLRLVALNASDVNVARLLQALWTTTTAKREDKSLNGSDNV